MDDLSLNLLRRRRRKPSCYVAAVRPAPSWTYGSIVVGCATFGGIGGNAELIGMGLDEAAACETLDEAASLGLTMLDTAERYAGGASDRIIGGGWPPEIRR